MKPSRSICSIVHSIVASLDDRSFEDRFAKLELKAERVNIEPPAGAVRQLSLIDTPRKQVLKVASSSFPPDFITSE